MKRYNLINNALGWLCFVISALTYLLTIEPTASFWDCPEFISQGAKLEVGHPPGNPIFMLTARFFVTLFGGDITEAAVAVNSMSALLSAATILLLFWTITHLVRKIVVRDGAKEISWPKMLVIMGAGLCGALAYTWSDTFWFSAVEGEVYAFSSFCTALVFWLILKWENRADQPHSDRYLVLIAYVIGVSIAVHLLNLLCIPAIVLVFYYAKFKDTNAKGSLIALGISCILVALILYGLVPGFIKVAQGFELFFVNVIGMSFNMGVLIYTILLVALFIYFIYALYTHRSALVIKTCAMLTLIMSGLTFISDSILVWCILFVAAAIYLFGFCKEIPYRIFNVSVLSIFVIFIGYSSYALLLIRASADTPMNQNAPDNVFTLSSYLNREQYGKNPLLYGQIFTETLDIRTYPVGDGQYASLVPVDERGNINPIPADVTMRTTDGAAVDKGSFKYTKAVKNSPDEPDKYVKEAYNLEYENSPDVNMLFTRMYSMDPSHIQGYKNWSQYTNEDIDNLYRMVPQSKLNEWAEQGYAPMYELGSYMQNMRPIRTVSGDTSSGDTYVWKPSFADNLRYFLNYQLNHMYWRYFMWNFAGRQNDIQGNGEPHLGNWISGISFIDNPRLGDQSLLPAEFGSENKGHNVFYMLPLLMGLLGIIWQSLLYHKNNPKRGIEQFWVVFFLFFMTGIAIVLYLNQPPGQPRERDYAFAGSFYAFAIWIGMGVPAISYLINALFAKVRPAKKGEKAAEDKSIVKYSSAVLATAIGILVPLQMVSQTWDDHDRSHRYATRDFGENYLNSVGENGIIFTNGDNDTFPLWYAQEVEGVRTDVKVVNLSYLATDWYANQLLHPYYESQPVPVMAKPTDWAYDHLAYSINRDTGRRSTALDALREFYDTPGIIYGNQPIKVLETSNTYSPIDTTLMVKAFALNPNSTDSITKIPYLSDIEMPGLSGGGFSLSKLLSYDIIANSINDGFTRPVYFATTVPNSFYLGLEPYLNTTGLAYQVTPFEGAPASPLADKAYENIVSKFRWGGLDDTAHNQNLYLDETVRRMVATIRNSMIETSEELSVFGDLPATEFAVEWAKQNNLPIPQNRYDMARYILNLMEEKLPSYVTPFDGASEVLATAQYLNLYNMTGNESDLQHAEAFIDNGIERYADLSRYAISLDPYMRENMGYGAQLARYHLPLFIGFKNYINILKALEQNPDLKAQYAEALPNLANADLRIQIYPYLYLLDMSASELAEAADAMPSRSEFRQGADLAALHEALGIDKLQITKEIADRYGITIDELVALNPYVR